MVVEGVKAGDSEEEVTLDIFVLGTPDLFAPFINNGVLVWVVSDGGSTGWGGEEMGEELGFWGDGERKVKEDGSGWGRGGNNSDGGFNDGRREVFYGDVSEWHSLDDFLKLVVDVGILLFGCQGILKLGAYNVSLLGSDVSEDVEEVGWGGDDGGQGAGAVRIEVCGGAVTTWAGVIPGVVAGYACAISDTNKSKETSPKPQL
jgi:hypothetical protein